MSRFIDHYHLKQANNQRRRKKNAAAVKLQKQNPPPRREIGATSENSEFDKAELCNRGGLSSGVHTSENKSGLNGCLILSASESAP